MWTQIIVAVISIVVSVAVSLLMARSQKNRTVAGEIDAPSVEYGTPIKVVLGTRDVKPTYTYFGDQKAVALKK
ncbi:MULTISPECIES: hypothetical protein [unclassified Acinetobacter]|uniref:hypothetical protein n=1 Tax=unclassified Acinetobacter TaxID=196816 RepID=UPI0015D2FB96|nr:MULTISPECIES: hypothetical protein [unclassified Acinetobacter]